VTAGNAVSQVMFMNSGEHVPLTIVGRDANDNPVDLASSLTFATRNPSVATVTSSGIVTSENAGATYVVVSLDIDGRELADSVQVTVGTLE
jgi:hypothetical protein